MRANVILGTPGYYGTGTVLVVRDYSAGRKNRYTVYYIPTSSSRRTKIIGRELPFGYANKLGQKYLDDLKPKVSKKLKEAIKHDKEYDDTNKTEFEHWDMLCRTLRESGIPCHVIDNVLISDAVLSQYQSILWKRGNKLYCPIVGYIEPTVDGVTAWLQDKSVQLKLQALRSVAEINKRD